MHPTDKYIYENVLPSKNKNFSTNLRFNDTNDLFNVEKKKHLIHHAKKINKYVFLIICFFFFLIIFNIKKILFDNN